MPLSEKSLASLNQLKTIDYSKAFERQQDDLLKNIFKEILSNGDAYKINEIENWLASNMPENNVASERILNVAHYQKAKHDAQNPLKMIHDSCGCGGDC